MAAMDQTQYSKLLPQEAEDIILLMTKTKILFSFVGNNDPYRKGTEDFGPVLSLLNARRFDRVILIYTGPDYLEIAKTVEHIAQAEELTGSFHFLALELFSPIDYVEIYGKLKPMVQHLITSYAHENAQYSVLLDPGTPQMQTVWFLLAQSGAIDTELLQGIPPHITGGAYKVKDVKIGRGELPRIVAEAPSRIGRDLDKPSTSEITAGGEPIIGEDPAFFRTVDTARRIAGYDISVLVLGETGTGKGMVARLIHENSGRSEAPFLPVNCGAISPSLAESELFGHAKGAFTGASSERLGLFRAAEGGTIFLDEIGDLPREIQPKLLRLLEDKTLIPVGMEVEFKVDVRIIAATNQDLEEHIKNGSFREDLYQRLNQVVLRLPPLRERKTDVPLLLTTFLARWNSRYGEGKTLSEETMKLLLDYPWPGNIREMQNTVISLCACSLTSNIDAELLPLAILSYFNKSRTLTNLDFSIPSDGIDLKAYLFNAEKTFYEAALRRTDGNREAAAKLLGLNAPAFRKALRERFGM